jgi:pyruvate dehydrogenase complex dehydrogenase (E1) component
MRADKHQRYTEAQVRILVCWLAASDSLCPGPVPSITLDVTRFGKSGSLPEIYRYHGIDTDSIVRAARRT